MEDLVTRVVGEVSDKLKKEIKDMEFNRNFLRDSIADLKAEKASLEKLTEAARAELKKVQDQVANDRADAIERIEKRGQAVDVERAALTHEKNKHETAVEDFKRDQKVFEEAQKRHAEQVIEVARLNRTLGEKMIDLRQTLERLSK